MYKVERAIRLPLSLQETWNFFSSPENLAEITPPEMKMEMLDKSSTSMYEGMVLRYKVSPLLGIKLNWTSEITKIEPLHYFVDKMIDGPFAIWHHQHFFEEAENGTIAKDVIHYKLPLGPIGKLFHPLLVKNNVNALFEYRKQKLEEKFLKD